MTTFLHIIRVQITDKQRQSIILKQITPSNSLVRFHPTIFTHTFSTTNFHPVSGPKKLHTMSELKCHFHPLSQLDRDKRRMIV